MLNNNDWKVIVLLLILTHYVVKEGEMKLND